MHVGRSGGETCHPYGIRNESTALHDTGGWARCDSYDVQEKFWKLLEIDGRRRLGARAEPRQ
jgi:hypothetical protein